MNLVDIKWQSRFFFGNKSYLFYFFYGFYYKLISHNHEMFNNFTNSNTQIVIEGYPRSANSSTTSHFHEFNPNINIAHHHHVPSQIIKGVESFIPIIVLIRNPIEAIASFKCYEPKISLTLALKAYISFYKTILPYKSEFIVASFPQVILDFDVVIARLNKKFKTNFKEGTARQFLSKQISPENEIVRTDLKEDKYATLLVEAFDLYQIFLTIENNQS